VVSAPLLPTFHLSICQGGKSESVCRQTEHCLQRTGSVVLNRHWFAGSTTPLDQRLNQLQAQTSPPPNTKRLPGRRGLCYWIGQYIAYMAGQGPVFPSIRLSNSGSLLFVKVVYWRFVMCCKWQARVSRLQLPGFAAFSIPLFPTISYFFLFSGFIGDILLSWFAVVLVQQRTRTRIRNESMQLTWTCMGNSKDSKGHPVCFLSRVLCPAAGQINWLQYDWWHCQTAFRHHLLTNLLKQLNESLPNDSVCLGFQSSDP